MHRRFGAIYRPTFATFPIDLQVDFRGAGRRTKTLAADLPESGVKMDTALKSDDEIEADEALGSEAQVEECVASLVEQATESDSRNEGRNIQVAGDVSGSVLVSGNDNQISINVAAAAAASPETMGEATFSLFSAQIETLSADLSQEKSTKLEELRELFREGATRKAYEAVKELHESPTWVTLSPTLRASTLRALATMSLSLKSKDGVADATDFAARATRIRPSPDDLTLQIRIAIFAEGHEAALAKLGAPATLDSYNLRLALLLETGKIPEALQAFRQPPVGVVGDAETHRLFALALLATKDVRGAKQEIGKALAERPRRINIRFQAATIDYFGAISELALPPHLVPFPRPVHLSMVRGDTESRQRLATAAEEFRHIAELSTRSDQERRIIETWQLACIANLADRQDEAIELCRDLLIEDPSNAHVLSWALFRRYDLDLSVSRVALEESLAGSDQDGNPAKLEEVLVLVGIYLKDGSPQAASDLLARKRDAFAALEEADLWRYWHGQVLIACGQPEAAIEESSQIDTQVLQRPLRTAALCEVANISGDWQPLVSHLEESYAADGDIHSLLILCDLKAKLGDWTYVADRAELYCDAVGTAAAARLVIAATWNAQRPAKCLQLLNQYEPLFGDKKLPFDLRRLRIHCRVDTDIKQALSEAEELAQEDESVESLMLLMDVRLTKGDLIGLELNARQLLQRSDVSAEQFLRAAHLVRLNNPSLAKRLWLRAVEHADSAELTAVAVDIAAKLGLEKQRGTLMERMMEFAARGEGPMKSMNMEQTLQIMKEGVRHQEQLQQMYAAGEAPIHLLAKGGLAAVFHGLAQWNRSADSRNRHHLLVRHGGRTLLPINYGEVSQQWRLHCDITSLLLAHELGVLEKIERLFKPLRISRHSVTALIAQRDKLKPHQKSQLEEAEALLESLVKGKFRVLDRELPGKWLDDLRRIVSDEAAPAASSIDDEANTSAQDTAAPVLADAAKLEQQLGLNRLETLAAAVAGEGFAVSFMPVQCYGLSRMVSLTLPNSLNQHVVNCRAIADTLRGYDRISEEVYQAALKALGTEGHSHAVVSPLLGSKLFVSEGVASVLIGANLFERTCSNFEVTISSSSVKEAEGLIEHYKQLEKIEDWLNELITRISDGVDEGTYEFISIPDERIAQREDREERVNQDFTATLDLLLFQPQEFDAIWVDDRALNKYPLRADDQVGVPLIGILEILLALRGRGELDEHDYYDLLLRLRESDFRYLPLDDEEVLHHLRQARIEKGAVVETEALVSLRRYYASCVLDKEFLQFTKTPDGAPNPHSELPFVIQTVTATADSIAGVWLDRETSSEIAAARADWILNNLYTGNFGCSSLRPDSVSPSQVFPAARQVGLDICNLLMRGIGMLGNPLLGTDIAQRRNDYFEWLNTRIIDRPYGSQLVVTKSIAEELQGRFALIKSQSRDTDSKEQFARAFVGKFFLDLPAAISSQMVFDEVMTEWLQLWVGSVVNTGDESFAGDEYWQAVEEALASGSAEITPQDSEIHYRFLRVSSGDGKQGSENEFPKISVVDAEGNQVAEMNDPSLGLLLPQDEARRATMQRLRGWFDCGQEEFAAEAATLVALADPSTRMTRLYEWRARSTELYYWQLEDRLRNKEVVTLADLLPPSFEGLAARLRLPLDFTGLGFTARWEKSAQVLLAEDELLAVVARFSSLPVAMPEVVITAVSDLPLAERQDLLQRIASSWRSPIRLMHVVNLALRCFSEDVGIDIARDVLARLYDEEKGAQDFASFKAVLTFVNQELAAVEGSESWSPEIRLVLTWIHACRLHDLMRIVGFSSTELQSQLDTRRGPLRSALVRDGEPWFDCAHPLRLKRTSLLTHGMARLLSGIDSSLLEAAGVPTLIKHQSLRPLEDDSLFPDLALLSDPILARDSLCSILGGDRFAALAPLIGAEIIERIASDNLKESVQMDLQALAADPSKALLWTGIAAVTDDLPIYPELTKEIRDALESLDPFSARAEGFQAAAFVFRMAAFQVTHLRDEGLREKYRNYILELLRREMAGTGVPEDENISLERRVFSLIEIASVLSYIPDDAKRSSVEFTSILEKMAQIWPEFVVHYGRSLTREVWDMPVDESEAWWHLTLNLRAVA